MARQVPFTEHEAALLLDAYLTTIEGTASRSEAIRSCSAGLRRMAINNGIVIDDVYRNVNGITFQMASMESAYQGRTIMKPATRLFSSMVEMYRSNREQYDEILKEARLMAGANKKNNETLFIDWLSKKVSPAQLSELYIALQEIEKQAKKSRIIKASLYEDIDIRLYKRIKSDLEKSKIFKFQHKRQMGVINAALNHLIQFVDEYQNTVDETEPDTLPQETHDEKDTRANELQSGAQGYRTVDFKNIGSLGYTKPISLKYFDTEKPEKSWRVLYTDFCTLALADYPDDFEIMKKESLSGKTATWLVDENNKGLLRVAKDIGSGFYVEGNRSALDFARNIRRIIEQCNINYTDVVVQYYTRSDDTEPDSPVSGRNQVAKEDEYSPESLKPYADVLIKYFTKGYRLGSNLEMKKFRRYFEEANVKSLKEESDTIEKMIQECGIVYDGRVHMPENMLDDSLRSRLFEYIEKCFADGKTAIYFEALFREFSEEFLDHHMYDADMLKAYIRHMCGDRYYIARSYFSKEKHAEADPKEDVRTFLRERGEPVETEELCSALSHIPEDKIRTILGTNGEFASNSKGEYFHADAFSVSQEELDNIAELISEEIAARDFISGDELYEAVRRKYPYIYEKNSIFSQLGWREALKYKLSDRFSFVGNVISAGDAGSSMSDVFASFAKERRAFTMDELMAFANSMGTVVYFDSLYKNAVRVSKDRFVNRDDVQFQVKETDRILDKYCKGNYLPLADIKDFAIFPEASHPWNIFLLEQYVASFSDRYYIMHGRYNKKAVAGAMVKKKKAYSDFDDFITDVLAQGNVNLKKKEVLDYLADNGFIARRSYTNIESLMINARARRNMKEK
ncbi:MAG: hypothetical protein KHX08_01365 [Clostridiales bacterium]|nr:hypothetical protein [Clostridiales bacterium]